MRRTPDHWKTSSPRPNGLMASGNRKFESISLQRRVCLSPQAALVRGGPRLSARVCTRSRNPWLCIGRGSIKCVTEFQRVPFGRDVAFDPGGATASRIAMPRRLPSTVPSVSASARLLLSWLNPPPHPITVYASHPPSPTTAQHSLPGGALPPYRGRSFTGRIASASPDAPELKVRIHLPPAASLRTFGSSLRVAQPRPRSGEAGRRRGWRLGSVRVNPSTYPIPARACESL